MPSSGSSFSWRWHRTSSSSSASGRGGSAPVGATTSGLRRPQQKMPSLAREIGRRLATWEGLLLAILAVIVVVTTLAVPGYLNPQNQINLLELSVEKAIVAALLAGALCGLFNGYWVAIVGLPSLAVTLAGLIAYRGVALLLVEDRSIGGFPEWFNRLGQQPLVGPFPLALLILAALLVVATVLLQFSGFGRYVYVVGSNREVARFSGVRVTRVKLAVFAMSGLVSAFAGVLLAARLGAVRGSTAQGFELDIITMVLLGGVSIFGGSGSMAGVILSILVILNLRNGLALANATGNTQAGVIGALLILSVLVPNLVAAVRSRQRRGSSVAIGDRI